MRLESRKRKKHEGGDGLWGSGRGGIGQRGRQQAQWGRVAVHWGGTQRARLLPWALLPPLLDAASSGRRGQAEHRGQKGRELGAWPLPVALLLPIHLGGAERRASGEKDVEEEEGRGGRGHVPEPVMGKSRCHAPFFIRHPRS